MNQQLIEDNLKLVYFIIHKYYPTFSKDEDIIQTGMLALCNAANTFDESKSKFATYASKCIRNEINAELRRRKKHSQNLSLDYEITDENGESLTFGDFQIGEQDVSFVDYDGFWSQLNSNEKVIYQMLQQGMSENQISEKLGCGKSTVYKAIRQMKLKWRYIIGDSN